MNKNDERRLFLKTSTVLVTSALFPTLWAPQSIAVASSTSLPYRDVIQEENVNAIIDEDDALNMVRAAVLYGLGFIPVAGGVVSTIVGKIWPAAGPSLWDKIKDQVNALVDQKIDQATYQIVSNFLDGLGGNLKAYLSSLKTGDPSIASQNFVACHQLFVNEGPQFRSPERQGKLLPLFAAFALLHFALLRDGVLNAKKLGWNESVTKHYNDILVNNIKEYGDYIDKVYGILNETNDIEAEKIRLEYRATQPSWRCYTESFFYRNEFLRGMQIAVLDSRGLFQYFDPVKYPGPVHVKMDRVVYSWPVGNAYVSQGKEVSYGQERTKLLNRPTSFSLYGIRENYHSSWLKVNNDPTVTGYTVRYDNGYGPWGNSNNSYGATCVQNVWVDNQTEHGPVVAVWYGFEWLNNNGVIIKKGERPYFDTFTKGKPYYLRALALQYEDGTYADMVGGAAGRDGETKGHEYAAPNCIYIKDHVLVDICDEGMFQDLKTPRGRIGCLIFGFQLKNMGHILSPEQVMQMHYVNSIDEPTPLELETLAREYQRHIFSINTPSQTSSFSLNGQLGADVADGTDEVDMSRINNLLPDWQAARQAFWDECDVHRMNSTQ